MKTFMKALIILLLALSLFPAALADGEITPYLQDDADLLTADEEAALYEDMLPLCEYGTPMFWTTRESGYYETLAERFYHSRVGYGKSGTLFVINMASRQLTIFSDGQIYRTVTNAEAETITDNVYRQARSGNYYDCAKSVYQQIARLLRGEQIARLMKIISNVLLALVLALLAVYLYISGRYETKPKLGKAGSTIPVTAAGASAAFMAQTLSRSARMTKQTRTDISSSSSGGHSGSGGGFSGGGGHSGGGGSHGF